MDLERHRRLTAAHIIEYRLASTDDGPGDLIACVLVDVLFDGLSLVYSFYDPELVKRSLVIDLRAWSGWSPYDKKDPAMKRTLSGAASGPGAVYEWDGNKDIGQGRMEILAATPPSKVTLQLDFLKPFQARNTAEFTLQANGTATDVTWALYGPSPYISKLMGLVFNMDRMIGNDFEVGLANLKRLAEQR